MYAGGRLLGGITRETVGRARKQGEEQARWMELARKQKQRLILVVARASLRRKKSSNAALQITPQPFGSRFLGALRVSPRAIRALPHPYSCELRTCGRNSFVVAMPVDYSKFDHIDSDSDKETPPQKPAATTQKPSQGPQAPVEPAKLPEEHKRPLTDAPKLEMPEGPWLKYYVEHMTAPQRMQTMVHFWNSAEQEERVEFLRHLIDIIGNPAISNKIKGGQEVLKDLDTSFYEGVTYPEAWLDSFKETKIDDKKVIFEKLFKSLDNSERGLVLGTLM